MEKNENEKDYIYFYSNGAMVRQKLPKYGKLLVTVVDGLVVNVDTTNKEKYNCWLERLEAHWKTSIFWRASSFFV